MECQVDKVRKGGQGIMDRWWKDNNRNGTKEQKTEESNEELKYKQRTKDRKTERQRIRKIIG